MTIKNKSDLLKSLFEVMEFIQKIDIDLLEQTEQTDKSNENKIEQVQISDFEILKSLLESDQWPEAVPSYMMCSNIEEDKFERAMGILDLISFNLNGKKLLDFGCGEGHLVKEASKATSLSMGYDIIESGNFSWTDGQLTTDWQKIKDSGPYDFVILFDVLDHCNDPIQTLLQLKEVCTMETNVFCRCHPWIGPHAGHYYRQLNKAYLHVIFNEEELKTLGIEPVFLQKVCRPIDQAAEWFDNSGFRVVQHYPHRVDVADFFKNNPIIRKRLVFPAIGEVFPEWQMSQSFNDYILMFKN